MILEGILVSVNQEYFYKLDKNKYYYLGFIHADGYLKKYDNNHRFSIHLSAVDIDWIKKFKKDIESEHKLQEYESNWGKPVCRLELCNKKFLAPLFDIDVKEKNIVKRIPAKYKRDFIRGVFDGDGSIIISDRFGKKDYRTEWEICSQYYELLDDIQQYFLEKLEIPRRKISKNGSILDFRYCKKSDIEKIYKHLYYADCYHLTRKKEKLDNLFNSNTLGA